MSEESLRIKIQELQEMLAERDQKIERYRTELGRANQALERMIANIGQDLKIASLIQRILSPTDLPHISGVEFSSKFVPGTQSGGDYFDIFEHEDKLKFGVVLACSSGYAMSALFLSILIQMSSKIEARKGLSPEIVLEQMAKEIVPNVSGNDEAHVFYAVLDRRNFELTFSSCGPIAAFLHREETDSWVRLEQAAPALSAQLKEKPLKQSVLLGSKDRLVLCTSGVMNTKSPEGQVFGVEGVNKCLQGLSHAGVHDIRNEILYQVEKFSGLSEPLRDQTVLVMEVKDRVIKLAKR